MNARSLFSESLMPIYEALSESLLALDSEIIEEFKKTQVSFGLARKFAWLAPLTKSTVLLTIDLWQERDDPLLRDVIRYRSDKFTHQIVARAAADIEQVEDRGWLAEAVAWGRRERPHEDDA